MAGNKLLGVTPLERFLSPVRKQRFPMVAGVAAAAEGLGHFHQSGAGAALRNDDAAPTHDRAFYSHREPGLGAS